MDAMWRLPSYSQRMRRAQIGTATIVPQGYSLAARLVTRRSGQQGVDTTNRADVERGPDAHADPHTLGNILGLILRLLDHQEFVAAQILVGDLAASRLADAKVDCEQSTFKGQIGKSLTRHAKMLGKETCTLIQGWISEGPTGTTEASSSTTFLSVVPSERASGSVAAVRHPRIRPGRRPATSSLNRSSFRTASGPVLESSDDGSGGQDINPSP